MCPSPPVPRAGGEEGMTIVEAMVAALVLAVGMLGTFVVLDGSNRHATVSERKEVAVHRAEDELERVQSIPFATLELADTPTCSAPCADTDDPRRHIVPGPPATYDWDWDSATNAAEPLVIKAPAAVNADAIVSRRPWSDGRFSGTLDTFVTTAATDLKRVTIAVRLDGSQAPRRPIVLSTLVARPPA